MIAERISTGLKLIDLFTLKVKKIVNSINLETIKPVVFLRLTRNHNLFTLIMWNIWKVDIRNYIMMTISYILPLVELITMMLLLITTIMNLRI